MPRNLSLKIFFLLKLEQYINSLVVECKHQHLLNVARALMFQPSISRIFWGECILTTVHLINRTLIVLLSNKIPFHVLFQRDVDYSLLRVFGCLVYSSTLVVNQTKFDPRSTPCVFIGYPARDKGFRLYDIAKHKFFLSRDVFFSEYLFSFQSLKNDTFEISSTGVFFVKFVYLKWLLMFLSIRTAQYLFIMRLMLQLLLICQMRIILMEMS